MFIGHFGVALAAKRMAPRTSLGTLFLAAQFADAIWPLFILLGLEQVRIAPGVTRVTPLDFENYPISHSLAALILWGAAFSAIYFLARREGKAALVVGACVLSHWFLDALVHQPDMPPWPDGPKVGLGIWNSLPATIAAELGLYAVGIALYLHGRPAKDRVGHVAFWSLVLFLGLGWLGSIFGPPPPSVNAVVFTDLLGWLTLPWAAWADRHRMMLE